MLLIGIVSTNASHQIVLYHGQRMPVQSCFSFLSHACFIIFDPLLFVILLDRINCLGMQIVKLILKGYFTFVKVHFGQLIELRVNLFVRVLNQFAVHHRFRKELFIKFLFRYLFLFRVILFHDKFSINKHVLLENSRDHHDRVNSELLFPF